MANKVTVTIDGQQYRLVVDEGADYVEKVAAHVDAKIQEIRQEGQVASIDAAILAALNISEELLRCQEAGENLRRQIKEGLEENKKLNDQLSEAKREIFKLQNQLGRKS